VVPHFSGQCREHFRTDEPDGAVALVVRKEPAEGMPFLRSFGPVPASGPDSSKVCRDLANSAISGDFTFVAPAESSGSLMQPALTVFTLLKQQIRPLHSVVSSFSPTAQAAAIIELCG
jgi:hypothetical protein